MKTIYLEQRGATAGVEHAKFFRMTDDGARVMTEWGPVGATGQSKVLAESASAGEREAAWDKKLREKTQRKQSPYVVISRDGAKVEERPSAVGRKWGLEVETHSNLEVNAVAELMRARGLTVAVNTGRYFESAGKVWDVKRDGSCGFEFASPILSGESGIFDAKVAVEKIREICPTAVNQKCGIHVTVGVEDHSREDLKRLAIGYLKAQEHFYALCAEWRQNNRYCQRNPVDRLAGMIGTAAGPANGLERVLDACGGWRSHDDRYHGLNWTRVFSIKAVEFRMLESTVAIRQVGAWIRTCVGFVDGIKKSGVAFKTAEPFSADTFQAVVAGTWTA